MVDQPRGEVRRLLPLLARLALAVELLRRRGLGFGHRDCGLVVVLVVVVVIIEVLTELTVLVVVGALNVEVDVYVVIVLWTVLQLTFVRVCVSLL